MHRNAALLHKQHRNDSCESRLYISLYLSCVNGNLSVLLSKFLTLVCISRTWRDFFLLAGALLHANYKMPFWDLTCWTCQCVNKVNLKKKAMRKKSDGHALLCCSHASFKVPPDRNQRELGDWEDLNAVFCFSFLFSLMDVRVTVVRTHECKGGQFYLRKPKTVIRWVRVILRVDNFSVPFLSLPAHMWNSLLLNEAF